MFYPRIEPLALPEHCVRLLRLSLNTPVVSMAELPVGPARAALLIHVLPGRPPGVTLGLRSLRTGDVILYALDPSQGGTPGGESGLQDAALTFAEGMGFVFDEDEVADGREESRQLAHGLWMELMGSACTTEQPAAQAQEPVGADALGPDFLALEPDSLALGPDALEQSFLEPELPSGVPVQPEPGRDAAPDPALDPDLLDSGVELDLAREGVELGPELEDVPSQPVMTDPRPAPEPDPLGGTQTRAALGRVKLVKRPGSKRAGEPLDPILRLLSSF